MLEIQTKDNIRYSVVAVTTSEAQADFLALPAKLYTKTTLMQDQAVETELLAGTHILSEYFDFQGFVVYRQNREGASQEICARAALTLYHDEKKRNDGIATAYLGFFEAEDNQLAVDILLQQVAMTAKAAGFTELVGPMNASFWIGYRMKTNRFEAKYSPYAMEPYNLPYYEKLWTTAGFTEIEQYVTQVYLDRTSFQHRNLEEVLGYQFVSPSFKTWDEHVDQIYYLISKLYASFPAYKPISLTAFQHMFTNLKYVADFKFIKLAYTTPTDGTAPQLVGFMITFPDYQNLLTKKITPLVLAKLLWRRLTTKRYLLMYLGVEPEHLGVGRLLINNSKNEIGNRQAEGLGALQRVKQRRNVNDATKYYRYILLAKQL